MTGDGIPDWAAGIKDALHATETRLTAMDGRFSVLEQKLGFLNSKINGGIAVLLLAGGIVAFLLPGWIRGVSQEQVAVHQVDPTQIATVTQVGRFTSANRVGESLKFDWKLAVPVDPEQVMGLNVVAESLPGVPISAEIIEDGTVCRMHLLTDQPEQIALA